MKRTGCPFPLFPLFVLISLTKNATIALFDLGWLPRGFEVMQRDQPLLDIGACAYFWVLPISARTLACLIFSKVLYSRVSNHRETTILQAIKCGNKSFIHKELRLRSGA